MKALALFLLAAAGRVVGVCDGRKCNRHAAPSNRYEG